MSTTIYCIISFFAYSSASFPHACNSSYFLRYDCLQCICSYLFSFFRSSKLHCISVEINYLKLSVSPYLSRPRRSVFFFFLFYPLSREYLHPLCVPYILTPFFFSELSFFALLLDFVSCLPQVVFFSHRWETELQNCRNPTFPQRIFAAKYRCPIPK